MKNKLLLIIVALFVWINLHASSMSNDSTKLESIQKDMVECISSLNNRTDYNSDSYLRTTIKTAKRLNELANKYFALTNDSSVFICSFMGEVITAIVYESHKQIDSAYVHSQRAFQLFEPYGRMICSTDSTKQWPIMIFGNDGICSIMREWNVKQGNLNEALNYCEIITDSCRTLNAEIEVVNSLISKGKVYEHFLDYESSVKYQVEALDLRVNMKDYSLDPFPSDIYSDILSTYIDWSSWVSKQYNNQDILQKFKSFKDSIMVNFLASHNFDFCIEEEKAGNVNSIRKLYNKYVGLLELEKMYDTFFDYEKGFDDFYIRNYGENSVYYANWLLKKKEIYKTYISNNKHLESFYIRKADTFYNNAESIWNNYIINHPLESLIQDYQNAKKTLSYNNTLASDYLNIQEILSFYYFFLNQQEDVQLGTGRYTEAKYTIEKQIRLSELLESDDLSFLYGRVANIYMESNEFKQAEKWYQKSLDIAAEKKDTIDMARANWSIYNLNIRQHNNGLAKQALYKAYDLIVGTKERSIDKPKSVIRDSVNTIF